MADLDDYVNEEMTTMEMADALDDAREDIKGVGGQISDHDRRVLATRMQTLARDGERIPDSLIRLMANSAHAIVQGMKGDGANDEDAFYQAINFTTRAVTGVLVTEEITGIASPPPFTEDSFLRAIKSRDSELLKSELDKVADEGQRITDHIDYDTLYTFMGGMIALTGLPDREDPKEVYEFVKMMAHIIVGAASLGGWVGK